MDTLVAIRLFGRIVETGSFSEAGRLLGMTPSSVSRQIAALEGELNALLFTRSSRRVMLTDAGRIYYEYTQRILAEIREAQQAVGESVGEPGGLLRVSAPVDFGQMHIAPLVGTFMARHPRISVELMLSDHYVDLNDDATDLAIRIGKLKDSRLIARRIAPNQRLVCASPAYLKAHGHPESPQDLVRHNCLTYRFSETGAVWRFMNDRGLVEVTVAGTLVTNNGHALRAAAVAGLGIILQPIWLLAPALRQRTLVPLLTEYEASPSAITTAIHAVYPSRRHMSAKIRAFIDFLVEQFGDNAGMTIAGAAWGWQEPQAAELAADAACETLVST